MIGFIIGWYHALQAFDTVLLRWHHCCCRWWCGAGHGVRGYVGYLRSYSGNIRSYKVGFTARFSYSAHSMSSRCCAAVDVVLHQRPCLSACTGTSAASGPFHSFVLLFPTACGPTHELPLSLHTRTDAIMQCHHRIIQPPELSTHVFCRGAVVGGDTSGWRVAFVAGLLGAGAAAAAVSPAVFPAFPASYTVRPPCGAAVPKALCFVPNSGTAWASKARTAVAIPPPNGTWSEPFRRTVAHDWLHSGCCPSRTGSAGAATELPGVALCMRLLHSASDLVVWQVVRPASTAGGLLSSTGGVMRSSAGTAPLMAAAAAAATAGVASSGRGRKAPQH
jgi:hypothetical protein